MIRRYLKLSAAIRRARAGAGHALANRSASVSVEFALALLPLIVLISGVAEFGRLVWSQHTLQAAVERGGHYVYAHSTSTLGTLETQVPIQVQHAIVGINSSRVSVSAVGGADLVTNVKFIQINATYPFTFLGILELPAVTVRAQARVPVE